MSYKLYLYHNGVHKSTETWERHVQAVRSGQNWKILSRGNTYKIVDEDDILQEIEYDVHMSRLLGGFL